MANKILRIGAACILLACMLFVSCKKEDEPAAKALITVMKKGTAVQGEYVYMFTRESMETIGAGKGYELQRAKTNNKGVAVFEMDDSYFDPNPSLSGSQYTYFYFYTFEHDSQANNGMCQLRLMSGDTKEGTIEQQ